MESRYDVLMAEIAALCEGTSPEMIRENPRRCAEIFGDIAEKFREATRCLAEEEQQQTPLPL